MKVLVYFEQEFFAKDKQGEVFLTVTENVCKVFEAKSDDDLLFQFDEWDFVPFHIRKLTSKFIHSGKKTMVWYLPESSKPHIKE